MLFFSSSESYGLASNIISDLTNRFKDAIDSFILANSEDLPDLEIRYVPIIMPKYMHEKYRDRTRVYRDKRAIDYTPHLNFECFVNSEISIVISEYVRPLKSMRNLLSQVELNDIHINLVINLIEDAEKRLRA